jgi:hypothetical protein
MKESDWLEPPPIDQRTLYEGNSILRGGQEPRIETPEREEVGHRGDGKAFGVLGEILQGHDGRFAGGGQGTARRLDHVGAKLEAAVIVDVDLPAHGDTAPRVAALERVTENAFDRGHAADEREVALVAGCGRKRPGREPNERCRDGADPQGATPFLCQPSGPKYIAGRRRQDADGDASDQLAPCADHCYTRAIACEMRREQRSGGRRPFRAQRSGEAIND